MQRPTLEPSTISPLAGHWDWIYYKSWLSLWLKMPDDVLHVFGGLLILVVAAYALRRAPWDWRPWLVVAVLEAANELYDVFQTAYVTDEGNWASAWHDFWMTMLWPTVILLGFNWLARRARTSAGLTDERLGEGADMGPDIGAGERDG